MGAPALYRIYIDEVGDHSVTHFKSLNQRYLTLFGVIVENQYMLRHLQPEMNMIKVKYFQKDPDVPLCFHRSDLLRMNPPYDSLKNPDTKKKFDAEILGAYAQWKYVAIAVTIDKLAHVKKYREFHYEPYYYCLTNIVERYVQFLRSNKATGDVMIETRNASVDRQLSVHFRHLYQSGTEHVKMKLFHTHLTSRELKLKSKEANICGLQLADLLALPAHFDLLVRYGHVTTHDSEMGRAIAKILLASKYDRSWSGRIDGYGRKILP